MHKKKGNESVLAGELILTFYKTGQPKKIEKQTTNFDIEAATARILESGEGDRDSGLIVISIPDEFDLQTSCRRLARWVARIRRGNYHFLRDRHRKQLGRGVVIEARYCFRQRKI